MNVVLVPALILLLGLVLYKKVLEPRRAAGGKQESKPQSKPQKPQQPGKRAEKRADKKATKVHASVGGGRAGSVL